MERYWLSNIEGSRCSIERPLDVYHLSYVVKKQRGDKVLACNHDQCVIFEITTLLPHKVLGIHHRFSPITPVVPRILFGVSQLESKAFEALCKQLLAMGVDMILPLACDNTHFAMNRLAKKENVEVGQLLTLDQALASIEAKVFVLGHHPQSMALEKALNDSAKETDILFIVGPERGWSKAEIAYFEQNPVVKFVSLGDRVFRADTAALLAMGAIHNWRQKEVLT